MIFGLADRDRIRLAARLERNSIPVPFAGCRLWLGYIGTHGYGAIQIVGCAITSTTTTQRASWLAHRGEIPDGLCVLHRCDVKPCIAIEHLFLGTAADNCYDKQIKGRAAKRLTADQVIEIRARAAAGESHRALGRAYGVDQRMVQFVVHREKWTHV